MTKTWYIEQVFTANGRLVSRHEMDDEPQARAVLRQLEAGQQKGRTQDDPAPETHFRITYIEELKR